MGCIWIGKDDSQPQVPFQSADWTHSTFGKTTIIRNKPECGRRLLRKSGRLASPVAEWGGTFPALRPGGAAKEGFHGGQVIEASLRELLVAKICGTEAPHDSGKTVEMAHRVVSGVEGLPEGVGGAEELTDRVSPDTHHSSSLISPFLILCRGSGDWGLKKRM